LHHQYTLCTMRGFPVPAFHMKLTHNWRQCAFLLLTILLVLPTLAQPTTAINPDGALNRAALVGQSIPASMVSGQSYPVQVTMKNTGTSTWVAGEYKLGSQNPGDNFNWGMHRVALSGNVAPGGNAVFAFNVTAPANSSSTPLVVNMQWGMLQEYREWFGSYSTNVAVSVTAPVAPTITVTRTPATLTATQSYSLSWSTTNATSVTRVCTSTGGGYVDNSTQALSGNVTATASAAWVGYPSTCTWTATGTGGKTEWRETLTTNAAPPSPPTVSVTRTPAVMTAGQNFTLSWKVTNTTALTRTCTASVAGGFAATGTMAFDASGNGSTAAAPADVDWVGKPSECVWTATGQGGTSASFRETMTTQAVPGGPVVTYIHTDGLGSPVARTNEQGRIISRTRYEPYGATAGGATPTIGFTGHVNDPDTGLTYMQQRYYDPMAGRFMSVDPVLTDANTGASFNRYVYANNNPYSRYDPDGRQARDIPINCIGGCETYGGIDHAGPGGLAQTLQPFKPYAETMGEASKTVYTGWVVASGGVLAAAALADGALAASSVQVARSAGDIGKNVIKWGTGQTAEAVATTTERIKAVNPAEVVKMIKEGLRKDFFEKQLAQYQKAIDVGGKKLINEQLLPRLELMEKILESWPKK
jgi:RHS repeat-associated protein